MSCIQLPEEKNMHFKEDSSGLPNRLQFLAGLICIASAVACSADGGLRFSPTSSYTELAVSGWTVRIAGEYETDVERKKNIVDEVSRQLHAIERVVPAEALQSIRDTEFWVEYPFTSDTDAAYHPSREWLVENGYNPDKAGGIELDYSIYLWTDEQPWAILHELSHAFHDKVLGDNNEAVRQAFDNAVASGSYVNVEHATGVTERAYALSDKYEYFAEISEAYFGFNDFQPFDREELKVFDPSGYALAERLWYGMQSD